MRVLKTVAVTGIVVAAVVVLALEPASGASTELNQAPCSKAIVGSGKPRWQKGSVSAGPVRVDATTLARMSRTGNGELVAKVPLLVEGQDAVTVSVPPDLRGRVHLYYGRIQGRDGRPTTSIADARGYGETKFIPCPTKPRTIWPGGMRIEGTAPVRLLVQVSGGAEPIELRLGRPEVYEPRS